MLREWINVADFESEHFVAQLVERLAWAVSDAHTAEQAQRAKRRPLPGRSRSPRPSRFTAIPTGSTLHSPDGWVQRRATRTI